MVDINKWIETYKTAWLTKKPEDIAKLFTDDATYTTPPDGSPLVGKEAIVKWWKEKVEPSYPTFKWEPVVLTEDTAVIQGRTTYKSGNAYLNLWIITFDENNQAKTFTEWWMNPLY